MAKQNQPATRGPTGRADNDLLTHKRAATAAGIGLGLQVVLAVVAAILGRTGVGAPLPSVFMFAAAGLIPWAAVMVAVAFRRAKTVEDFEIEAALRSGDSARTLFATEADARPAARRMARVYRWGLPIASILLGLVLAWQGFWRFRGTVAFAGEQYLLRDARLLAGVFAGFAFIGFVVGRYLLGMSSSSTWSVLRGGATYTIGTVVIFALMAVSAGAKGLGTDAVNRVVMYVVPLLMLLVGIEVLLNLVLDLYRPKTAGETVRPAFDSRLLSLLASPGGAVRSLNDAINYQFGFEITQSWFWRLLSRSFVWLLLFGLGILVLLSSIVVVEPHEMGLVTRFGRLADRPLGPGTYFKAPWPLTTVDTYEVTRVEEMVVGSHDQIHPQAAILWTSQHTHPESLLIVAPTAGVAAIDPDDPALSRVQPLAREGGGGGAGAMMRQLRGPVEIDEQAARNAPSIGLATADVFIQWKIDPAALRDFATSAENPALRLRQIANAATAREMLKYDIDAAIGPARPALAKGIEDRIRQTIDQERLGIQVLWVGLAAVHPPQSVAGDFNLGAASVQQAERALQQGISGQNEILTAAAGSVEAARDIIAQYNKLEELRRQQQAGQATGEQIEAQQAELERLIQRAGGLAARRLLEARQQRWTDENAALAESILRPGEYLAYQQAPEYYLLRRYLQVLAGTMGEKEKIVLMTDDPNPLIDFDYRETLDALNTLAIQQREQPAQTDE